MHAHVHAHVHDHVKTITFNSISLKKEECKTPTHPREHWVFQRERVLKRRVCEHEFVLDRQLLLFHLHAHLRDVHASGSCTVRNRRFDVHDGRPDVDASIDDVLASSAGSCHGYVVAEPSASRAVPVQVCLVSKLTGTGGVTDIHTDLASRQHYLEAGLAVDAPIVDGVLEAGHHLHLATATASVPVECGVNLFVCCGVVDGHRRLHGLGAAQRHAHLINTT